MEPAHNKFSKEFLEHAHDHCSSNKEELLESDLCGCFCCEQTFSPSEIREWFEENIERGKTAVCPRCGIDSVLSSRFPIADDQFLKEMKTLWF